MSFFQTSQAHLAALLAVIIYFRKEFAAMIAESFQYLAEFPGSKNRLELADKYPYALLAGLVIFSAVPAGIMGFVFKDMIESIFKSPLAAAGGWIVTGLFLVANKKLPQGNRPLDLMSHRDAFIIGVAQGLSLIPGISRAAATILAGIGCEIAPKDAVKFSFLVFVPLILIEETLRFAQGEGGSFYAGSFSFNLLLEFALALILTYAAIILLMRLVEKRKLHFFGFYCLAIGIIVIASPEGAKQSRFIEIASSVLRTSSQ